MDGVSKDGYCQSGPVPEPFSAFNASNSPSSDDSHAVVIARLQSSINEIQLAIEAELGGNRSAHLENVRRARELLARGCKNGRSVTPAPPVPMSPPIRGGLSPWQIRKIKEHISSNLHARLAVRELSDFVCLSRNHFSRAFRQSFGESPHTYVSSRRIEYAQRLMMTTMMSLSQIAAECGLNDQPHFNRLFRRFAGNTPAAWRRMRVSQRFN